MKEKFKYDDEYDVGMPSLSSVTIPALTTAQIASLSSSITGPYPSLNTGLGAFGSGSYTIAATGSNGSIFTTNGTSGANWASISASNTQPSIKVNGDAEFEGKVKINGQDLAEFMDTISKRLAILVPDPAKLEHFEALKKAYDHYKMMEKLCELPPKEEKK